MMTHNMVPEVVRQDSELVSDSLSGNREAFGQIVSRYQSLVCSIAYSATGSLSESEDLAQDTFIAAWRQLRDLREPGKLRAWLCGIARNLVNNFLRKQGREPSHRAAQLEEVAETDTRSPEPIPADRAISKEEAELLWRSLELIPETYREALVLFYREHQSIETVAANLDLTEDAVKQRLSRGRKLLQEQFLSFVEGALARTNPGRQFTLNVLAALPALTLQAKVASIGAAAAKGGAAVKGAGIMGLWSAVLTPVMVVLGNYASYRISMDEAHTDVERSYIKRYFKTSLLVTVVLSVILGIPSYLLLRAEPDRMAVWALLFSEVVVIYFLIFTALGFASIPQRRQYLAGILAEKFGGEFPASAHEYRSRWSLFGWPLLHVRIGDRFDIMRGPVKAWIAIGSSHAVGLIFASGGLAVAPISFGGIAIGIVSFGAISVGFLSLGALALGVCAYGGAAIGWQVFCGFGAAWKSAMGGFVFALQYASGSLAHAAQANTKAASDFFRQDTFTDFALLLSRHGLLMMLLWVIPMGLQARVITRARKRREQGIQN